MKIKITTGRLPHKYPKGEIHEVESLEGALKALVEQGEAVISEDKEYKKPSQPMNTVHKQAETMEKALPKREQIKKKLKEKGIKFKNNQQTKTLEALLK